ncbi:M48 family metalloprotease [Methylopila sp. M107]|uniref:M48 family metalloprotease n=1 Tax=Methylopila sp. M107 TaxID=1101190 RepID=UPI00037876E3|nr:M48 family metalloprotease [Methylopila sp. M107]
MTDDAPASRPHAPLGYLLDVVERLKRTEPEVWAWASSLEAQAEHSKAVQASLLRETYRLTPVAHASVYDACAVVLERLGLSAPVTLYQAGSGDMNAALVHLPGEAHLVFYGPVLERLGEAELAALLGHELAHYKLWSESGGEVLVASRILEHTLADPGAAPSHVQTARLFRLYVELYADRGAAIAVEAAEPAITTLVKVQTGLQSVDPAAYLAQAVELEGADPAVSQGQSHPETYLRARAVDKWWRGDADFEPWLRRQLHGPLSMASLDLADQEALQALTRGFIARFLGDEAMRSEAVLAQVRGYFPDWREVEPPLAPDALAPERIDDSVRDYLGFVLLDLALADPDLRDHALARAAAAAAAFGAGDSFLAALKRDAGAPKREVDALARKLKAAA